VARRMPWRCVDRLPSAVRPSPVPQNPSLHPPSPQCRRSTNSIDTRTLRSASLDSTLPRRPHLHLDDAYTMAKITPPRKLRARRTPSIVRGLRRLRTSSGSMQGSRLVLQLVVGEQAASVFHPHPQHLQAAQRDGGQHDVEQHVPSLATSAAGRRLCASRHNSALRAPKAPQPLHLCALRQPASTTVKAYHCLHELN